MEGQISQELITVNNLPPAFGGQLPGTLPELRPFIEQAKNAWLSKSESEKTRQAYENDLEQFLVFLQFDVCEIEQMTQILPEDVSRWRDYLLNFGG